MRLSLQTVTNEETAFTLERQSRSRSGSQERRSNGSVHGADSQHVPTSRTRRIVLAVTVDESEWARARATIMHSGGSDIEVLRVVPVAGTSDLRIQIGLESNALDQTMSRIMRSLKAAEFGPAQPATPPKTKLSLSAVKK